MHLKNDKMKSILKFIIEQINQKGYPPSVREICTALSIRSTSSVHSYLDRLEKEGYIMKDPTKPRALKIINQQENQLPTKNIIHVPIVGKVTAGEPILAIENIENTFPISADFLRQEEEVFMLKTQGDSMIDAGIFDGDYILVRKQSFANNGEIVVALIEDEATVKTFYKEKNYYKLKPENKNYAPIIIKNNFQILGKVIGLFRRF